MKKIRNTYVLLTAMIAATFSLSSCSKDDDKDDVFPKNTTEIVATNVINSSDKISHVKVDLFWEEGDDFDWDGVFETPYLNNGFTMVLPKTIENKYLEPMVVNDEEYLEGIFLSNKKVKSTSAHYFYGYDKNDEQLGRLYYVSELGTQDRIETTWLYVDNDIKINGKNSSKYGETEEHVQIFDNLRLKKGWNITYNTFSVKKEGNKTINTVITTNNNPSNTTLKWYYIEPDTDYYSPHLTK